MSTRRVRLGTWHDISMNNSKHNERRELWTALFWFTMVFIIVYTVIELLLPDVHF